MSNKALSSLGAAGQDLLSWALEQEITGGFYVDNRVTTENNPFPDWWGTGILLRPAVDIAAVVVIEPFSGRIAVNHTDKGQWMDWKYLATAVPPNEYDISLADGIIARDSECKYRKAQDNVCTISISCEKSTDGLLPEMTIATLPEGYRPAHYFEGTAYAATSDYNAFPATIRIWENGEIKIWFQAQSANYFIAQVTFLAE